MKVLMLALACWYAASVSPAQEPLLRDAALKQLYNGYDSAKETAEWVCPKAQEGEKTHEGWPCWKEYSTVDIEVIMISQVQESSAIRVYLVTSARPASYPDGYECHACAPAIGVGVFAWQHQRWVLESSNTAVGFYGGWGRPPGVNLVEIGPGKHGLLLSINDEGQGYSSSFKKLLLSLNKTVSEVWSIEDEQDDFGAYDPTDKFGPHLSYRSSAALTFYATNLDNGSLADFYDIEVISRGTNSKDLVHSKPENWTEIYRFRDGTYRLFRHTDFVEVKKPVTKAPQ